MPRYIDNRGITNMIPSSMYNKFLKEKYNFTNDDEFRLFMQKNGKKILQDIDTCDMQDFKKTSICPICMEVLNYKAQ